MEIHKECGFLMERMNIWNAENRFVLHHPSSIHQIGKCLEVFISLLIRYVTEELMVVKQSSLYRKVFMITRHTI